MGEYKARESYICMFYIYMCVCVLSIYLFDLVCPSNLIWAYPLSLPIQPADVEAAGSKPKPKDLGAVEGALEIPEGNGLKRSKNVFKDDIPNPLKMIFDP